MRLHGAMLVLVCVLFPALGLAAPRVSITAMGDPKGAGVGAEALAEAVDDATRQTVRDGDRRAKKAAARISRAVRGCGEALDCYQRVASQRGVEVWVARVEAEDDAFQVVVAVARPKGREASEPARVTGLTLAQVKAAVYGAAYRGLGGKGTASLSVQPEGMDAKATVTVDGKAVGRTPLSGTAVPAGSAWVQLEADGFLPWRDLVQLRPNKKTTLAPVLDPDVGAVDLVGLVPTEEPAGGEDEGADEGDEIELVELSPEKAAETAVASEDPALSPPPAGPSDGVGVAPVAVLGVGAASLAGFGFFGSQVQTKNAQLSSTDPATACVQVHCQDLANQANNEALAANVLLGVGSAAILTGGIWLIIDALD